MPSTPFNATAKSSSDRSTTRPAVDGSLEPLAQPPATVVKTHRSRRTIALAVALIALCAVLGWWAFSQATHTSSVVAMRSTVRAGEVVQASDLGTVNINDNSGLDTVPASQMSTLIGKRAQVDLAAGGVVSSASVADSSIPGKGSSVVGISLKAGMAPASNLTVGSPVRVVFLPAAQGQAQGEATSQAPVSGSIVNLGSNLDASANQLDVLVPAEDAPAIQTAAAQGRIAVLLDSKDR